jgi:hypothetical protein
MACARNPYGDGYAAKRIVERIRHYFDVSASLPAPKASILLSSARGSTTPSRAMFPKIA